MNTYTPIPDDLPPLLAFDSSSYFPKHHSPEERWDNGRKPARYFVISKHGEWADYTASSCGTPRHVPAGFERHYIELLPIDFKDPCYQKYVEDQFIKGAKVEIRYLGRDDSPWQNCASPIFDSWDSHGYRIAQPAPKPAETEVEKKSAFDFFGKVDSPGISGFCGVGTMSVHNESGDVYGIIAPNKDILDRALFRLGLHNFEADRAQELFVSRLTEKPKAPPAPVFDTVPLDDCKVGEAIRNSSKEIWVISKSERSEIECQGKSATTVDSPKVYMEAGWEIFRNGWLPMSKQVERKG